MAAIFQIRRGSGSVSLVDGELYVNKGIDSLQYAVGDREITLAKLDELNTGTLYLSGGISASGDITASNMYVSGNVVLGGTITIGDTTNDSVIFNADLSSSIIPDATNTYDLGSTSKVYRNIYANSVSASSFTGSLYGMGDPTSFSTSVDLRLDRVEASSSLYDNEMSGSNRLYVSPSGSDSYDGKDPSTPFRTIKAAVESLYTSGVPNPSIQKRHTIFVGSGNYTEQNPIVVPPGVAIVGDNLRTVRLTASNPTKDYFHCHEGSYFYGLRFLNLQNPSFCFSFPCSTATGSISAGGVSSIGVVHSMTGYTDGNNQDLGIIIEGPDASGSIATATANVVGGVITQINVVSGGTNYSATEKPYISIPAPLAQRPIIGTSPYIQNCSSITGPFTTDGTLLSLIPGNTNNAPLPYNVNDVRNASNAVIGSGVIDEQGAGGGIRIDGNLVHPESPLESIVADAFTQVNQGGPGHLVINKGYAQFVSCFTTFCTYGFKTANGGFANVSNSVIDFGAKGLVSKTYFPQTYNTGSSLETLSSYVTSAEILQDGAGYTGSIASVTISGGGGTGAIATASVNVFGSIDDIVITNSGSGYTSEPNLTIATPTGASPIQATVVGGKANISGIPSIKFQLQSGSRGVDVSSNMIFNGIDYLVTSVATGSNGNERYVSTYPSPPSVTTGDKVYFHQLSNISTGGLVMEYVGSGVTYNALPKFGGVPNRNREITEYAPGRVFYSTVDNIGNIKIGDFFAVNQLTGEVTIDARSFNLSGINNIGPFKRNGVAVGVVLQEVSNNTTLLDSQFQYGETVVPTQYAVKGYIDVRDNRLNNLESTSASVNGHISDINTYTASLKTAIDVTGGNTRILGNLIVDGTQTSLNVNNVYIEDKLLTLSSGSATSLLSDGSGFEIAGANVSMSWEHTNTRFAINTNIAALGSISSSTIVGLNGASVTTYSTSVDSRLVQLQSNSGSSNSRLTNLESFTGSQNIKNSTLATYTSSLELYTASVNSDLVSIHQTTSSLNTFTASIFGTNEFTASTKIRLNNLESTSASISSSVGQLNLVTASLYSYTSSTNIRLDNLESTSASISSSILQINSVTASFNTWTGSTFETFSQSVDDRLDDVEYLTGLAFGGLDVSLLQINTATASLQLFTASVAGTNTFTSSTNIRLNNLELTTASLNSSISQINSFTASNDNTSLNLYTSSLKGAITISGTDVSIAGGLTVLGTTTIIDTTILAIKDNIIELNAGGGTNGGLVVRDVTGTTTSGSLLWDTANDYWIAGPLGAESKLLRQNGDNVVSGSSQITYANISSIPGGIISSSAQIDTLFNIDGLVSGSSQITYSNISSIPAGIVSGSSQITYTSISSIPGGIVSGSSQVLGGTTIHSGSSGDYQFNSIGVGTAASALAGEIRATNDITAFYSSDIRLKENIQPIQNALEKVESISGNTYDWKEGYDEIHSHKGNDVGVIAQEIEAILPQIVTNRDNGYKAVQYEKIVPLLIEAIKELSAKIKRLENK